MPEYTGKSITIRPTKGWIAINFRELWHFRGLLYTFTWRDIKVRYKQAVIGILWALIQPFTTMVIFSVFFGGLAKVPSDGVPYPIFVFSGLLFWNYFSTSLTNSSNSLIDNENIIKKVYFPRLILPISPAITPIVDFFIALVILGGMMVFYKFTPSWESLIYLPILILLSFLTASGVGSLLAAINVRYRDIRYALPFFIQIMLYLTPVIYPTTLLSEKYQWLLALNPMTGIIETARSVFIHTKPVNFHLLLISFVAALFFFFLGIYYFRRTERIFADVA
ncbi:MAG: ABC transporter permease [Patescibacteria group bacterium]|jgi:lipopolysaccharide transport system permease protein